MTKDLVKQDINFLEYPLWFQDMNIPSDEQGRFTWKGLNGFVYKAGYKPPVKVDQIFLTYFLLKSQQEDWSDVLDLLRSEVLTNCGLCTNRQGYQRLEDSLERWKMVGIKFEGIFYDGKKYSSMNFGVIDSWKVNDKTGKLRVRFSPEWLAYIKQSNYFKYVEFEKLKSLRSPLALRLYELLVKTFQSRGKWKIDAVKLAKKIPMQKEYPAHIIPKIKSAISRINKVTDLQIRMEVTRPKRGKAVLIFSRMETIDQEPKILDIPEESEDVFYHLLELLPDKQQEKKTIHEVISRFFRKHGEEYVKRNILYANLNAKKNYRVYLAKALKEDWGITWWKEHIEETEQQASRQEELLLKKVGFQEKLEDELAFYTHEFIAVASEEEFTEVRRHVEQKTKELASLGTPEFESLKTNQLLALLKRGIEYHKSKGQ